MTPKERPILFTGAMVRALLSGQKTQTRRVLPQLITFGRTEYPGKRVRGYSQCFWLDTKDGRDAAAHECRHGRPGDRLWVRETWMPDVPRDGTWPDTSFYGCKGSPLSLIPEVYRKPENCLFRSTWNGGEIIGWRPSIHMPRWASRITLEITSVRVERLQEISELDALSEGTSGVRTPDFYSKHFGNWLKEFNDVCAANKKPPIGPSPSQVYRALWESINGPGSWDANPWVWVLEFKRTEP